MEVGGAVEQMHGAAASAAASFLLAIHFGHHRGHRNTADKRMRVLAIGCDNTVALFQDRDDTDSDRFLAIIDMQEPADLFLRVKLNAFAFEATDADHLL